MPDDLVTRLKRNPRLVTATALLSTGFILSGSFLVPWIGARYLHAHDLPDQDWVAKGYPIKYAGPVMEVVPATKIDTPRTVRATQSKDLSISISPTTIGHSDPVLGAAGVDSVSDEHPRIDNMLAKQYTVGVTVGGDIGLACAEPRTKSFGDAPVASAPQMWRCVIHPKDPGDYKLFVSGLPAVDVGGTQFEVRDQPADGSGPLLELALGDTPPATTYRRDPDGTVTLDLQVLTVEGLTATQDAWLKTLGALLGILGTLFGYPFLKRLLDRSPQTSSPAGSAATETQDLGTGNRGRQGPLQDAPQAASTSQPSPPDAPPSAPPA